MPLHTRLLASATILAATLAAHADMIPSTDFSLQSDSNTITFAIPEGTLPGVWGNNFDIYYPFGSYIPTYLNGVEAEYAIISFFQAGSQPFGLTFNVSLYFPEGPKNFSEDGPQVYTGQTRVPQFPQGSYTFTSGDVLLVTKVTNSPVPEPSTLVLMGTGLLGAALAGRYRPFHP